MQRVRVCGLGFKVGLGDALIAIADLILHEAFRTNLELAASYFWLMAYSVLNPEP